MNPQPSAKAEKTIKSGLERGAGLALWRQIAARLRADIQDGHFSLDGQIPREMDLAEQYGVNRHTVRRAIAELTAEGLLEARRGEGTFVSSPMLNYPVSARTRFHEIVSGQARIPHGKLLSAGIEPASALVAEKLNCRPHMQVWRLETLYMADREPISTASTWFSNTRFPELADDFRQTGSLTRALQLAGITRYERGETRISARLANEEESARLRLPVNGVVLTTEYVSHDGTGTAIQFAKTRFAANRVQLLVGNEARQPGRRNRSGIPEPGA